MLTQDAVSVKTQNHTVIDDVEYSIGQPHRKAYENSTVGREKVIAELPQSQQNAIFAIWGETPTVTNITL